MNGWWQHGGAIGWNEYNPLWHIDQWLSSEKDPTDWEEWSVSGRLQRILEKQIWDPLYKSVCYMTLEEYNAGLDKLEPRISKLDSALVPDWHGKLDHTTYIKRRQELDCPASMPAPTGEEPAAKKEPAAATGLPGWGLLALGIGGTALLGVGLFVGFKVMKMVLAPAPNNSNKKKKRKK